MLGGVDRQAARAQEVAAGQEQAQEVHGVLPARGAVDADVRDEFGALGGRVPGEGGVGPAGEEGLPEGEEFLAHRGQPFHQRGVQALQDVRVGAQGEFAEAFQLPGELLLPRALHMRRRFLEAPEEGVGATYTPRRSVSLASVARPNAREPMTHA